MLAFDPELVKKIFDDFEGSEDEKTIKTLQTKIEDLEAKVKGDGANPKVIDAKVEIETENKKLSDAEKEVENVQTEIQRLQKIAAAEELKDGEKKANAEAMDAAKANLSKAKIKKENILQEIQKIEAKQVGEDRTFKQVLTEIETLKKEKNKKSLQMMELTEKYLPKILLPEFQKIENDAAKVLEGLEKDSEDYKKKHKKLVEQKSKVPYLVFPPCETNFSGSHNLVLVPNTYNFHLSDLRHKMRTRSKNRPKKQWKSDLKEG